MGGLEVLRRAMDRIEQARDWATLHECVQAADVYYQRGVLSAAQAEDIARACRARSHEIRLRIHRPAPRAVRDREPEGESMSELITAAWRWAPCARCGHERRVYRLYREWICSPCYAQVELALCRRVQKEASNEP